MTPGKNPPGLPVRLEQVRKVYAGRGATVTAIGGIDLAVEPGEFFILLGPSGCGKSTLLDLLAGLAAPDAGTICFGAEVVADPGRGIWRTPKERNVAMVFQSYALYPHLSVAENIAFPLRVGGARKETVTPAVRAAAASVQILDLLERKPAELSGGQRQRVAIARALVRHPALFLLDEPLSNLDARLRTATRARLKSLQRNLGVTTVYVTHDQQEALALGDRVAVLKRGHIEQIGPPGELIARPATAFVARFAGNPPMNMLRLRTGETHPGLSRERLAAAGLTHAATFLLGVRPERIALSSPESERGWPAEVESVEPLGRDHLVHLSAGERRFSVLTAGAAPCAGERVRAEIDFDSAQLFPDDGEE